MAQRITVRPDAELAAIESALENILAEINARSAEIALRRSQGRGREVARLEQDQAEAWAERRNLLREQTAAKELATYGPAKPQQRRRSR